MHCIVAVIMQFSLIVSILFYSIQLSLGSWVSLSQGGSRLVEIPQVKHLLLCVSAFSISPAQSRAEHFILRYCVNENKQKKVNTLRLPPTDIKYSDFPVPTLFLAVHSYTPLSLRRSGRRNTRRSPTTAVPSGRAPPPLPIEGRNNVSMHHRGDEAADNEHRNQ